MQPTSIKSYLSRFLIGLFSLVLTACSGSGTESEDGSGDGSGNNYVLQAVLVDSDGNAASSVSSSTSLTLRATLTNNGSPVAGEIISFAVTDSAFASLSGTTVPTDANGTASVSLTGGATAGTGGVTVSADANLNATAINIAFESQGESTGNLENNYAAFLIPASTAYNDYAGITQSTNTSIAAATPATLLIKLTDSNNTAISNHLVSVDFSSSTDLIVNDSQGNQNGNVITDENGFATLNFSVGTISGVGEFVITFSDGKELRQIFESAGDRSTDNYLLQAVLVDSDDTATNVLTTSTTATLRATLTNNGAAVGGQIITFAVSDSDFATLSGFTVATDNNGIAEIQVTGGDSAGTGTLTLSADDALSTNSVNIAFTSTGAAGGSTENVYEVYLVPQSTAYADYGNISASSNTSITNATPATFLIKFSDSDGNAITNDLVSVDFSQATGLVVNDSAESQNGKVLTDDNGFATLALSVGDVSGVGILKTTFSDGKTVETIFQSAGDKPAPVVENDYIITAALLDDANLPASTLSSTTSLNLQVTLNNNGTPVPGEVVTISISDETFASLSGTTLTTDTSGQATITLTGGSEAGQGTITIVANNNDLDAQDVNVPFRSLGVVETGSSEFIYEAYLVPSSTPYEDYAGITASTLTTISATEIGKILVQYTQEDATPVNRSLVTVSLDDTSSSLATLSNDLGTILTDENGFAVISLAATNISGAGYVQVAFEDGTTSRIAFVSTGGGNQEPPPNIGKVKLEVSNVQLASSGSDQVDLFAYVIDNEQNLMEGIEVSFTSDTGAIQVVNSVTGANGIATAKLNTFNNPTTRTIEVEAFVAGHANDEDETGEGENCDNADHIKCVDVTGTTIKITGSNSIVIGDKVDMTVVLLDSDGNGIPQRKVYLSSTALNSLTKADDTNLDNDVNGNFLNTDSTGSALFKFNAESSTPDTIVASALGESGELAVSVSSDSFVIGNLQVNGADVTNDEVPLSGGNFTLTWQRNSAPFDGDVLFSLTRGKVVNGADSNIDITSAVPTGADGQVTVGVVSSDAGPAILTATADGVSASYEFEFVAETAHQLTMQSSPASIGPNGQKSTISAKVYDKDGNAVKNRPVNFRLYDVSGGSIFPATVVTDSDGLATTVYTSNNISAVSGVVIAGCTDTTGTSSECVNTVDEQGDDDRSNDTYSCTAGGECVHDDVQLTVADRELFIALGTGNSLEQPSEADYEKLYSIIVTDADSNPVEGVELTASAIPVRYFEGSWQKVFEDGDFDRYDPIVTGRCFNEDVNGDGVLDRIEDVDGDGVFSTVDEDLDNDGRLDRGEDVNDNGVLDEGEDLNGNGTLDLTEDLNNDGTFDVDEDLDNDLNIDVNEDIDGDGNFDEVYEDLNDNCTLDDGEDIDNDLNLDLGEDINCNGVLDTGEDLDGDGILDRTEDIDGDGRFDQKNEDVDGDGRLDEYNEDIDGDGHFDNVNEDVNGDFELDVIEVDYNQNGVADSDGINEDRNGNGVLDPGNVVAAHGNLVTDANGVAELRLRYSESYGAWVEVRIEVKAKVAGTEYSAEVIKVLGYDSADSTVEDSAPTSNLFGSDGVCSTPN